MMEFLYFPENKLEYLPSVAFLIITLAAAMYTMMFILKISKKQEIKAKELEDQIMMNLEASKQDPSLTSGPQAPNEALHQNKK